MVTVYDFELVQKEDLYEAKSALIKSRSEKLDWFLLIRQKIHQTRKIVDLIVIPKLIVVCKIA